jgi:hypothetical protein
MGSICNKKTSTDMTFEGENKTESILDSIKPFALISGQPM